MSDGNPELLSTSQVGAPSFLNLRFGLAGAELFLGGVGGAEWGPAQAAAVLSLNDQE